MTSTLILQVQLGSVDTATSESLAERFHRFYDEDSGRIEYPVSCDSHAFDVFRDEFETEDPRFQLPVDYAAVVSLPYDVDHFVPFTEDNSGTVLFEATGEPGGWADVTKPSA